MASAGAITESLGYERYQIWEGNVDEAQVLMAEWIALECRHEVS